MFLFKRKKYKIKFFKSRHYSKYVALEWREITDASIIKVLKYLQTQFDFKIISIKLQKSFSPSKIVIRCNKTDKYKIFMEFVKILSGNIEKVKI